MPTPDPVKRYTCRRCGCSHPLAGMHHTPTRVWSYCKACLYQLQMIRYQLQMIRWNRQKARAVRHLGGRCMRCGFEGHPVLFDFDHRDPGTKLFSWNRLRLRSWGSIETELAKCDLLCAHCHRLRHSNPELWPDWQPDAGAASSQ